MGLFQGILLDATKTKVPFGIVPPTDFPGKDEGSPLPTEESELFYTVCKRFTYFQSTNSGNSFKKIIKGAKKNKMTVRLRPRQVLCSKCRSICVENSDNVKKS